MVVLDPRTGRLVSISLSALTESRTAAPRAPARPQGERSFPPHRRPEDPGAPRIRPRTREGG